MESIQHELIIKMILDAWLTSVKRTDDLLNSLSDEKLLEEIAPARNNGVYLLGHLVAIHDRMMTLLGFGKPLYPELFEPFVNKPYQKHIVTPSISDLKEYWKKVNSTLEHCFNETTSQQWFQKHTSVSEEDFVNEPHRNKLNIIISRTNHLEYHRGQLILLKNKL